MPDDHRQTDAEIILAAYADKVKEAFKIFAENLGMGQNQKNSAERFLRAMELVRQARDMALEVVSGATVIEPAAAETDAAQDSRKVSAADLSPGGEGVSAEDQKMIEQVLAGTTGHRR